MDETHPFLWSLSIFTEEEVVRFPGWTHLKLMHFDTMMDGGVVAQPDN